MKLVIAEKPSVAQSLAAVLGAKERGQGYLQGNGYVVSWCVGHLIGLAAADSYDPKYSKWCYEDLPIIPKQWKYAVAPRTHPCTRRAARLLSRLPHRWGRQPSCAVS